MGKEDAKSLKSLFYLFTYGIINTEQNRPPGFVPLCYGALAQLARAPALQAGGQEFESLMLHHTRILKHAEGRDFCYLC